MLEGLRKADFDNMRSQDMVWTGSPSEIRDMIMGLHEAVGGFEVASLLSNSWILPTEKAEPSLRLFAAEVIPHFSGEESA